MGQQALFTLDAYPGLTFYGKIFYIGANTASEFSLIPPDKRIGQLYKGGPADSPEDINRPGRR